MLVQIGNKLQCYFAVQDYNESAKKDCNISKPQNSIHYTEVNYILVDDSRYWTIYKNFISPSVILHKLAFET